jgi:hypothetical protein
MMKVYQCSLETRGSDALGAASGVVGGVGGVEDAGWRDGSALERGAAAAEAERGWIEMEMRARHASRSDQRGRRLEVREGGLGLMRRFLGVLWRGWLKGCEVDGLEGDWGGDCTGC